MKIEYGKTPTTYVDSIWFLPTLGYSPCSLNGFYRHMVSVHFLKWYFAVKWSYNKPLHEFDE